MGAEGTEALEGGEAGSHGLDREETLEELASRSQTAVFRDVVYSASSVGGGGGGGGGEAVPHYEMGEAGNAPWGASLLENVAVVGADRAVRVGLVPLSHVCAQVGKCRHGWEKVTGGGGGGGIVPQPTSKSGSMELPGRAKYRV